MIRSLVVVGMVSLLSVGASAQQKGRVVIIGVDGMDHALTDQWLDAGELPALAWLRDQGSFRALRPTNPAQSPTSWASLVTGTNPGRTGIFGFLYRGIDGDDVVPEVAMVGRGEKEVVSSGLKTFCWIGIFLFGLLILLILRPRKVTQRLEGGDARKWRRRNRIAALVAIAITAFLLLAARYVFQNLPESISVPVNRLQAAPFWRTLDEEGVKVVSLGAPCAFPAPDLSCGQLQCGLGVPDLRGTPGTAVVYEPGGNGATQMGSQRRSLVWSSESEYTFTLDGPRDPLNPNQALKLGGQLVLTAAGADLTVGGIVTQLTRGVFSDFVTVTFSWGELRGEVEGIVRFRLQSTDPPVLYQGPVQFHPGNQLPFAPVTFPFNHGGFLTEGPYATAGWPSATGPYQDELIDDATLLEQVGLLAARRSQLTLRAAKRDDWRVLFSVFSTPDRVQHMFWRDIDPEHPNHDAEQAKSRGNVILESYRRIDRLVAKLQTDVLKEGDVLLVVSDHGFAPFRRAVNINRWLAEEEWFALKDGSEASGPRSLEEHLGTKAAFGDVDWSKTRVFNLGLGRLWLNLRGREPHGIVAPEERDALLTEVSRRLLEWKDHGRSVVRSVTRGEALYSGGHVDEAPDLVIGFERGYRISWNACLGGTEEDTVFDNRTRWSGDHCSVDPALVPGVLLSSRKLPDGDARVTDVYPTLRALLGLEAVEGLDGRTLTETR
ncbi:MAG: hypothetical protein CMJ83_00665 [Planctomycetes bacterium]|nr:hypothetical protein [Planctomycetota bacterium]